MADCSDLALEFKVIELSMLKKSVFFPLSSLSSFTSHTILYPLVLVRTRLQLQEGTQVYSGLIDAARSILREEGVRGLYNGYLLKCFQLISGLAYTTTYESVRLLVPESSFTSSQRSFIAGSTASSLAQTLLVPVDIIAQHLMLQSRAIRLKTSNEFRDKRINTIRHLSPVLLSEEELKSPWKRFSGIVKHIAAHHGIRGFYHGYFASLCTFVPISGYWWYFYDRFCQSLAATIKNCDLPNIPRLAIQLTSAPLAGITSAIIINPLDCVRVRMQVSNLSFKDSLSQLWRTEGFRFAFKGLSARLLQSSLFSFWLILFYEPVKIYSLKDEYKSSFKT